VIERLGRLISGLRVSRYAAVGAFCAAASNVLMIGGDFAGLHYGVSCMICFVVVTPVAYLLHAGYTFREGRSLRGLGRFAWGGLAAIPLWFALMAICVSILKLPMLAASPLVTAMIFVWNYAAAHWAILGRRPSEASRSL
jgi:putative flippase GtrA